MIERDRDAVAPSMSRLPKKLWPKENSPKSTGVPVIESEKVPVC
jgi:hypothetical protein